MEKIDIRNLNYDELKEKISEMGEPAYRTNQIYQWIFKRGALTFGDMNNVSKTLISKLEEYFYIGRLEMEKCVVSKDGTEKYLFKLNDTRHIETVLIPSKGRNTVCISTQVGCRFRCVFCASGRKGYKRDLTPSEIIGQVLYIKHVRNIDVSNIVFMGMGEPLDNYDNVEKAIRLLNDSKGMGFAARRLTISTSGIVPGMKKLEKLNIQINLSVSLHAVTQKKRFQIMPNAAKKYPLSKLLQACEEFLKETGRMITLEYVLLKDINDTEEDAHALADISYLLRAKINILVFSPIKGNETLVPEKKKVDDFVAILKRRKMKVTKRESKGDDINAACGQLAGL